MAIAFLGTSKAPLAARVVRAQRSAEGLELAIALSPGKADPDAPVRPYYPVAVWRGPAPKPPFAVRFVDGTGGERARIDAVRPLLDPFSMCGDRPACAGDPLLVGRVVRHPVEMEAQRHRIRVGENVVRVHTTPPLVLTAWLDEGGHTSVWVEPPPWLAPVASRCLPTDLSPEAVARARDAVSPPVGLEVLTLGGARPFRHGREVRIAGPLPSGPVWLACDRELAGGQERHLARRSVSGHCPARAARHRGARGGRDLARSAHPLPRRAAGPARSCRSGSRCWIRPGSTRALCSAPFSTTGFDRDPNQGAYVVHHGPYERGRHATWLSAQDEAVTTFELFARLGVCRAESAAAVADDACNTTPAVQLFYAHEGFLRSLGLAAPLTLRLRLESPRRRIRSRPFTVTLGDEPTSPAWEPTARPLRQERNP
ncbi:MAG: hypothetical protein KatS3mg124_1104 [Porticoccaceae bacterium]|nr:MAG: hypothetical protein KatS3mg124_1104 [Porticoccaceae bacterium]